MSGVSMCRVVWVGGREGALWLPAGGIIYMLSSNLSVLKWLFFNFV